MRRARYLGRDAACRGCQTGNWPLRPGPGACRYVAAVPGPDLPSDDLPRIPSLPWERLTHRQVLGELVSGGWVPSGAGDWVMALRSPEGTLIARVCPFDPAYRAFVDLHRECVGNRWLPRIDLAADLEGGGSVVFLEFAQVRRAARMIDTEYRKSMPWWDGLDLNQARIRQAAGGRLVLIDIFCMDGASLYRKILQDVTEVHRWIPWPGCSSVPACSSCSASNNLRAASAPRLGCLTRQRLCEAQEQRTVRDLLRSLRRQGEKLAFLTD